jgi:hypothetical protein
VAGGDLDVAEVDAGVQHGGHVGCAGACAGGSGTAARGGSEASRDYDPKAVRVWAESQGIDVSMRGRVPADLIAKFQEANA